MSALFSEIYGCYYGVVARVLNRALQGSTKAEIEETVQACGFSETAFHLLPQLIGSEWNFLHKRGEQYYSNFSGVFNRPLTTLERSWLAALLKDPRIHLFLDEVKIKELHAALCGVVPAFNPDDFLSSDKHLDGDAYDNPLYRANFRKLLAACTHNAPVAVSYDNGKTRSRNIYYPYKLSYSEYNDKFRLQCAVYDKKTQRLKKAVLNLAKITAVEPSELPFRATKEALCKLFSEPNDNPPIVIEITTERNAVERFLLQFASFDRKTEYDPERNIYTCHIFYDMSDETELLIRILSFGPTVKVLGPQSFLQQIKDRLKKQMDLMRLP
ncbi:MAG: WYL domain-containing protein [Firmicutes bacterium]|nr:WYL domain-containing protein [Bacillota bacterium]